MIPDQTRVEYAAACESGADPGSLAVYHEKWSHDPAFARILLAAARREYPGVPWALWTRTRSITGVRAVEGDGDGS